MKEYTGMYIVRPTLEESAIKAVITDIAELFEGKGGKVLELNEWGIKELAYEIDDFKKGYYVKFKVAATAEAIEEFNRVCSIKEDILRHILVSQ